MSRSSGTAERTTWRRRVSRVAATGAFIGEVTRRAALYRTARVSLRCALGCTARGTIEHADYMNRLGVTLKDAGRYDAAARCYSIVQRTLAALVDQPTDLAATLEHNLAGLAHARGDWNDGIAHVETAIRLRAAITPPNAAAIAADRAVLAALLAGAGRVDEAGELFARVVAVTETLHGPDHYEVAVALHNLAALEPDPERAEQHYQRAIAIKTRTLGRRHPEVAALQANLAVLYARTGRRDDALAHYRNALPVLRRRWGRAHLSTRACEQNLARCINQNARQEPKS